MTGSGKFFRIRRQTGDAETLHAPTFNLCHFCGRPIPDKATIARSNTRLSSRLHG
jgi:hypothetical protein